MKQNQPIAKALTSGLVVDPTMAASLTTKFAMDEETVPLAETNYPQLIAFEEVSGVDCGLSF